MGRSIAIGSIALALGVHPATALDPHMRITQYFHTAWRVQDGAFEAASNAVTQTADGYIWIGTGSGFVTGFALSARRRFRFVMPGTGR